ncbi:MAG TPA: PLP-dependent aspartate aminotransferase family protein [Pyrinomonadaceae bacterium]|nr:PLP-dependent aspartate aminotransferase family protein [Pyrinomonadaceae bacterium]
MAERSFNTLSVHAGVDSNEHFGAVSTPIYPASIFAFEDAEEGAAIHNEQKPGYYYGRLGNPTTDALERTMAELENGEAALAFASGMAAASAVLLTYVKPGDNIVAPRSMYATTTKLFAFLEDRFGVSTTFVDAARAPSYAEAATPETRIFWIETPSNPLVQITDIAEVTSLAANVGAITIADNTFATPYNQRPIELGVDVVIHSATKYLGGHSDLTAGVLVSNRARVAEVRNTATKLFGGNIAPQIAWLVMRGIKTLALRMERHNSNAFQLADFLSRHAGVAAVHYPGLATHNNHEIAKRQMRGFGGMIGLDVGSTEAGKKFVNSLKLATLATSLGGVETIVQHSASMTHSSIPSEIRTAAGISDGLIRVSVGIEDITDLMDDFDAALMQI